MSALPIRGPLALTALSLCLVLAGRAVADPPDLTQFSRENQVAAQKAERDIRAALAEAKRLEATNPETALQVLRRAQATLDETRGLTEERRRELAGQLEQRQRHVQETLRRLQSAARQEADNRSALERERERRRLGQQPRPADQARDFIKQRQEQVGGASALDRRRQAAFQSVMADIDRASIPVTRDVTFPKNWRRIKDLRKKYSGPKLTKQEENLIRAMNSTLSVEFNKIALRDVLNYLADKTGTSIIVDKEALREAQVEYDDPVEFTAKKVAFRTVLRKVLADRGLAYILNQGVIEVVTPQKARETLVTRTYPIADLMTVNPGLPPLLQRLQMLEMAKLVVDQIQAGTDPSIWKENGGPATITFNPATMSLVIRAPAEMHYSLNNLFTK
jgi:hypothetical protein